MDPTQRIDVARTAEPAPGSPQGERIIDVSERRHWPISPSRDFPGDDGPGPLAVAWRDRWRVLLIAVVSGALAFGISLQFPTVFAAETTLVFPYSGSEVALPGGDAERSRSLRTEAERITSFALLQQAAEDLGDGFSADTLSAQISAMPASSADIITVRATATTGAEAASVADAVARAYRRQVDRRQRRSISDLENRRQTLEQRVSDQQAELADQLAAEAVVGEDGLPRIGSDSGAAARLALEASVNQLSDVQARLDQMKAEEESAVGSIQVLWPAQAPSRPEQPRPARNAATVIILALMAYITVRWWRAEPEAPRITDAQTAEAVLGVPVIAEIPPVHRSPTAAGIVLDDYPQVIDAYRMAAAMTPIRGSVLVTSADADAANTDLVLNVGDVLRRDGYQVLLIEADSQMSRMRGTRSSPELGLTDLVAGRVDLERCLLQAGDDTKQMMGLVPWGSGSPGLPRGSKSALAHAIDELAAISDLVLIDGPPLASSADALNLAANVDGILLVLTIGTTVADASRLHARLKQLDRPILGLVVQHTEGPRRVRRRRVMTAPVRWTPLYPAETGGRR